MTEQMKPRISAESVRLGVLLALVGGFLDAYTYVTRDGVFAGAQTGNVVLFGIAAAGGKWHAALVHLPPLFAFMTGVVVAESFTRPSIARILRRPARAVLIIEMVVLFGVGFIPTTVPNALVTVIVSFVAAVQVTTFRVLVDAAYNTTMTTGNLRTLGQAVYHRFADGDRAAGTKGINFGSVVFGFLVGAGFGALCSDHFGVHAIWVASGLLALALVIFLVDEPTNFRRPQFHRDRNRPSHPD